MDRALLVFVGGGIGSLARYLLAGAVQQRTDAVFPIGTLAVNVAGCFLIGLIMTLAEERTLIPPGWRLFLTVGFCGGFTTFSTYSYEALALLRDSELALALLAIGGSVLLGLAATWAGLALGKLL